MHALSLASEATKIVIPVRYVARGQVVHATSTALTADDVHVRSANPPPREVLIDFKLYFPNAAGIVSRSGVVADTFGDEFRAEFLRTPTILPGGESQSCCGAARSVCGPTHVSTPTCPQSFGRMVRRSPRATSRTSAGAEPS